MKTIIEFSRSANSCERVMLVALAKIWLTIDTSQDTPATNVDITIWLISVFERLDIDHQNFESFKEYVNEQLP